MTQKIINSPIHNDIASSSNPVPRPQLNGRIVELIEVDPECSICLEVDSAESKKKLGCGHEFHARCINQWITQKPTCPLCRHYSLPPPRGLGERALSWIVVATLETAATAIYVMPDYLDNPLQGMRKTMLLAASFIHGTAYLAGTWTILGMRVHPRLSYVVSTASCLGLSMIFYSSAQRI